MPKPELSEQVRAVAHTTALHYDDWLRERRRKLDVLYAEFQQGLFALEVEEPTVEVEADIET